jgi:hypothetical protein
MEATTETRSIGAGWATAGFITEPTFAVGSDVFTFPNNEADAVLHLATGVLFLAVADVQTRRDRVD